MNPESRQSVNQAEGEIDIEEIDAQIEALKESHPRITKEEYWTALKQAKIAYAKLKEIIKPMQAKEIGDYDAMDRNMLGERREARFQLALTILNCKDMMQLDTKRIVEAMDDSTYFFMPDDRPGYGEANPIFGAEKLVIPELLPAVLVLSEQSWLKAFPDEKHFDEAKEKYCSDYGGFSYPGNYFDEDNILFTLGLNIIRGDRKFSEMTQSARHESVHAVDFLKYKRNGVDRLISELIAYRIDGIKFSKGDAKKKGNPIGKFFGQYLEEYSRRWAVDQEEVERVASRVGWWLEQAKLSELDFDVVTEILLNSETIEEFMNGADIEIRKILFEESK